MATALAFRLRRLEAIRDVAEQLIGRPQLDRDVFGRGAPEPIADIKHPEWTATLYDLLSAYAVQRQKQALAHVRFAPRTVWSLAEARDALERLVGAACGLEPARRISDRLSGRAVDARDRDGVELCRRRSKWCARARSRCSSTRPSRRFMSASVCQCRTSRAGAHRRAQPTQ